MYLFDVSMFVRKKREKWKEIKDKVFNISFYFSPQIKDKMSRDIKMYDSYLVGSRVEVVTATVVISRNRWKNIMPVGHTVKENILT
jgi:hypothetical protein